eukprot:CAMPEP_0204556582 /NCGR_PEP_ID=MMETSP0661-20131031/29695_1 /ASSEMBLY_ACC=CAM_ASM_000606 /TAXON_ID=109239 /ORGANISM="Alexandrium margalefi, Strain AMGDE01CS-322" /LENGTH=112 /DNA_ID=CAMNT_0051563693 /DNA_START=156 /DNA_END=491 /DNA_ORIENTATION=+
MTEEPEKKVEFYRLTTDEPQKQVEFHRIMTEAQTEDGGSGSGRPGSDFGSLSSESEGSLAGEFEALTDSARHKDCHFIRMDSMDAPSAGDSSRRLPSPDVARTFELRAASGL